MPPTTDGDLLTVVYAADRKRRVADRSPCRGDAGRFTERVPLRTAIVASVAGSESLIQGLNGTALIPHVVLGVGESPRMILSQGLATTEP